MILFNFLFRFHLTGSGLSSSELKVIARLDPIRTGLAERVLLEGGDETAAHLLAGFCVGCVTGTSESVSTDTFSEESESSTILVCFLVRETDGREGFVKNFVSVCCLAMVEFKIRNPQLLQTPNEPRDTRVT